MHDVMDRSAEQLAGVAGPLQEVAAPTVGRRVPVAVWPYVAVVALFAAGSLIIPGFARPDHVLIVLNLASFLGLAAAGQTLVILTGGIDLSVSAVITLASVLTASIMMGSNANFWPAIGAAMGVGLLVGLTNGIGVAWLDIPPLVMTLGTTSVTQGAALIYTNGAPKGNAAPLLVELATGRVWGVIPYSLLVWAVVAGLVLVGLHRGVWGRWVYAVGNSPRAARYSGVNVRLVLASTYVLSGLIASLAGVLLSGYTRTSYLNIGDPYQLASIAAVVVGGASILGGSGSYLGTIAGAIIITAIQSLLPALAIPEAGRQAIFGLIILVLLLAYGRQRS